MQTSFGKHRTNSADMVAGEAQWPPLGPQCLPVQCTVDFAQTACAAGRPATSFAGEWRKILAGLARMQ
jgi:hypothetical protein